MTITFENNDDVIIYALGKVIAYARRSQQIFGAQCVWWLPSVIGLELGLIAHIDTIQVREYQANSDEPTDFQKIQQTTILKAPAKIQKQQEDSDSNCKDRVLNECEAFLWDSRRLRELAKPKATGRTKTGRINPLAATKQQLRVTKERTVSRAVQRSAKTAANDFHRMDGIDSDEIARRKLPGECYCCAWPSDRKSVHKVKDCVRPIKLDTGTANFPKAREYRKQQKSELGSSLEDTSEEEDSSGRE